MRKKAIWLIVGFLTITAMVLASCSPAKTPTPTPTAAGKPQGDLVVAISSLAQEGFLPTIGEGGDQTFAWENVFDVPIYVKEKTWDPIPGLATKWDMSADAKTLTLTIRKGVKFHPGDYGEVTAEDFKYSYERYAEPGSQHNRVSVARKIASMDIPDPYTLVIHLKDADPTYWRQLDECLGNTLVILSKKYVTSVGDNTSFKTPVGSGPFNLVEHAQGSYLKFEALDEHWRVVPEFKTLTMRIVPEESTRIAMLKTGEVDATPVSGSKMAEIKAAGLEAGTAGYGGSYVGYYFGGLIVKDDKRFDPNTHMKDPWKDIKVREAMNIAVDRAAIVKALFAGTAVPAYVPFQAPGYDKVKAYPYDPARAKTLMTEAGFAKGFHVDLYVWPRPGTPEIPKIGEAMAGYWKDNLGLDVKIIPSELPVYRTNVSADKTAGTIWPWRISVQTDPSGEPIAYLLPDSQTPLAEDEKMTPLIRDMLATVDFAQRNAKWEQILKYINENYLALPMANIQNAYAWNQNKVDGANWPHGNAPQPGYYSYIRHAKPLNTFRLFTP